MARMATIVQYRYKILLLIAIFLMVEKVSFSHDGFRFIENKGQWNEDVAYKASIPGGDLYVLNDRLKYVFYSSHRGGHEVPESAC